MLLAFCFFKQKTAYDVRISDWSSDVCSSDLCSRSETVLAWYVAGECEPRRGYRAACRRRQRGPDVQFAASLDDWLAPKGGMTLGRFAPIAVRSEERSVGQEVVSTCISRGSPYP